MEQVEPMGHDPTLRDVNPERLGLKFFNNCSMELEGLIYWKCMKQKVLNASNIKPEHCFAA